ncbi:MAG: energy-coupling factor transporter ATPase [Acutalibacteraceae bacterium]|nr:energy-coupling factor transporter ATPase [Acutalibacteraceae bacterium]
MHILEVENLKYVYSPDTPFKHSALNGISFSVEKNAIVGIIGHTGSGKSTLLQLLNGLLKPSSGCIKFGGVDIWENPKKISDIRFKIGLVFQYPEYQLFEETVWKDIAYGPKNMKLSTLEIESRVSKASQIVSLDKKLLNKSPFDLSGGEKRRVAIAGIMAMEPDIIIFDEPTAGLDPIGRETVLKAINEYRENYGATVIIVSHSMEDMAYICDKILVLNDGNLVMYDTVDNVFANALKLKEIGLNIPIITSVMLSLKERGFDVPTDIFTVEAAAKALITKIDGGKKR